MFAKTRPAVALVTLAAAVLTLAGCGSNQLKTAVVRGTVGSTQVHATLGRADGCETAAWEQLKPLLQP